MAVVLAIDYIEEQVRNEKNIVSQIKLSCNNKELNLLYWKINQPYNSICSI